VRFIGLGLEFLSRHATIFLAVGVLSGLVMPDLAHLLRPMLGLIVLFNLVAALVRLNFSEVVGFRRRPLLLLIVLLFVLILSPIALASILNATVQFTSLSLGLVTALVLMAAAPPITSAPAFALILGLDAAFSVLIVVVAHLLVPFSLPVLAIVLLDLELDTSVAEMMMRLALIVGGSLLLTFALKRFPSSAEYINRSPKKIEGLSVLGLILFAIAIMDGVGEMALARPDFAILTIVAAFSANAGLQAVGVLVFWRTGKRIAFTIGHMTGNCNMGLVLAVLGSQANAEVAFFFALAQLPMYMLPLIALPIYRRFLPENRE
jgi:BASS family bile acid:Na+ symporter